MLSVKDSCRIRGLFEKGSFRTGNSPAGTAHRLILVFSEEFGFIGYSVVLLLLQYCS